MVYPGDDQPEWITQARSVELLKPGAALLTELIPENFSLPGKDGDKDGDKESPDKHPDGKKVILDLIQPKPKGRDQEGEVGYGSKGRRQMDQQIERLQDNIKDR